MSLRCQNSECNAEISDRVAYDEDLNVDEEVIQHQYGDFDGIKTVTTDYYCDARCFLTALVASDTWHGGQTGYFGDQLSDEVPELLDALGVAPDGETDE